MASFIYLDNASTTRVFNEILSQMPDIFEKYFANPNSIHTQGQRVRNLIEDSRRIISKFVGSSEDEIIFTSCATESNNTIIRGTAYIQKDKNKILVSPIEHKSVLNPARYLAKRGFSVEFLKVDKTGVVDIDDLEKRLDKDVFLVSVIHGNNETGVLQDITKIGKLCREREVLFFSDVVQSFLKEDINLEFIDFFSVSGHKINAPKGIGLFYKRKDIEIEPLLLGGGQEKGYRSGTENPQYIKFISDAVKIWNSNKSEFYNHLKGLREYFEGRLKEVIPDVYIVSDSVDRLPHISCVIFPKIDAQTMILALDSKGVCVSSGSACSSGAVNPSHVLLSYGFSKEEALRAVRFSFGIFNSKEEVDKTISFIKEIYDNYMKFIYFS
ncbi:MAG: cysteine desulfurase [Aquificae bacterium]|nr:cysteine desulfurase [Aquificota bacterium]